MIIGLMAIFAGMGTFNFGDVHEQQPGIFSQVRPAKNVITLDEDNGHHVLMAGGAEQAEAPGTPGRLEHAPRVPDGMVLLAARNEVEKTVAPVEQQYQGNELVAHAMAWSAAHKNIGKWRAKGYGYWLLVVAGLGIFCGCVGKSAQFPLHVWLPDAMEGPTPVSALIHAATMVAAGVYLVGRCYPIFTPEVLLVIAVVGTITLFIAATIAITATDIKRVLAYSTVSQLGYMMLALGLGGWLAGMFHLFTHAFFKALLFLCSGLGDPRHGHQRNAGHGRPAEEDALDRRHDARRLPGDRGGGHPAGRRTERLLLQGRHPGPGPVVRASQSAATAISSGSPRRGAAITAFYMFRLWYMTFAGKPRDEHVYHHAHESPWVMVGPLVVLAFFAVVAGWTLGNFGLPPLLEQARPLGTEHGASAGWAVADRHASRRSTSRTRPDIHVPATLWAFGSALAGFLLATVFYGLRKLNPDDVRRQFAPVYRFLVHKWWFDELYAMLFVRPVLRISDWVAACDKQGIDRAVDGLAWLVGVVARLDEWIDRIFVDGLVDGLARVTYAAGLRLRAVQSGNLRQYVMWIAVGTVALFLLISFYWNWALAGT